MKGKSMKLRLCRVYADRVDEKASWQWFREYFNPKTGKKEKRPSPCQNNPGLLRR